MLLLAADVCNSLALTSTVRSAKPGGMAHMAVTLRVQDYALILLAAWRLASAARRLTMHLTRP